MSVSYSTAVRELDGSTVMSVTGDLDIDSREHFLGEARPLGLRAERLVLDLSDVGFVDSTGIGAIVEISQLAKSRGRALHVVPSRRARAALQLSGVLGVLISHDSLASALLIHPSETS